VPFYVTYAENGVGGETRYNSSQQGTDNECEGESAEAVEPAMARGKLHSGNAARIPYGMSMKFAQGLVRVVCDGCLDSLPLRR
jgi:hypothetical protein